MMGQKANTKQSLANNALENLRMRLVDLTARNRLVNFRHSKNGSLRIIDKLPNQLVEPLLAEREIRFEAIPEPTEKELIEAGYLEFDEKTRKLVRLHNDPTAKEWAEHLGFETSYEVPAANDEDNSANYSDSVMQILMYPYEMESRLRNLRQSAESAIQEMGANILYLTFGFLEWYENTNNDSARIAPLFLVPVRLHKGRLNPKIRTYEYTLSYSGEDIIPNLSLREKLRIDYNMALPDLDENTLPEDYFGAVHTLIKVKQPRWRVRRYISLALLNFSKLLMYIDLDPARWPKDANIVDHPVVSRFLHGCGHEIEAEDESAGDLGFGEEYPIDEMDAIHTKYPLIDDADSSQHSALIDAIDGKNLVIEGPPGTGKSQTITNLIASAMMQGKKVLFVAEKLAALEVVRRRLDNAGLGEFCLELHSHKSQKRRVLDEVDGRLKKHGHYRKPKEIDADIARYEEHKNALKKHAEKINRPWKNTGKTLHEIFMAATRYRNAIGINPEKLHPDGYDGSNYNAATKRRNEDQVEAYRRVSQAVARQIDDDATLQRHPWYGVRNSDLQIFDLERVKESLGAWQGSLQELCSQLEAMARTLGCDVSALAETLTESQSLLDALESIPPLKGDEILDLLPVLRGDVSEKSQQYLELFEGIQTFYSSLAQKTGAELLRDLSVIAKLRPANEVLKRLVGRQVKLGDLAEAINRLNVIKDQLVKLNEPLQEVISALGEPAARHLTLSESGLAEFKAIIELITSLNPSYWKHRDELFDNEELDELLPRLQVELDELRVLHEIVDGVFNLKSIPDESKIRQLADILTSGGLFRWFKPVWRSARKQLLSYAANAQVKYHSMVSLLGNLASFAEKHYKLENNILYKEALGEHLQGLETDHTALMALRAWYKSVRLHYGFGFGQKVALGDAILELSPSIAKAIRSLAERDVPRRINGLFNELNNLKDLFTPLAKLHDKNALLVCKEGEGEGIIPRLLNAVNQAIQACAPIANNDTMSMAVLSDHIEQIGLLKRRVEEWQKADLDKKIFGGRLGLNVGAGVDNSAGLSKLRNTLGLAASIEGQLNNKALVGFLYDRPAETTFSSLASHAEKLRVALEKNKISYEGFAALVCLDHKGWAFNSGDLINDLIHRNQLALDNGEALQSWLDYVRVRDHLALLGLGKLADVVERCELQVEQVENAYQASIFDVLAKEILREDPEIGRFSGFSQEAIQKKYREYDDKLKKLQCHQIAWKVDQTKIPRGNTGARVSERTELVLLEHECGKKTRHIPIRQLLQRAGNALVASKPCFMMSPLSVAQYLAPGNITFDLVVMDEASQIKPQDALGAIARGGQLVVVGDPKQLPPTNFFDRLIEDDEDDPTGIEESESILDATLPMFPARRLRWHYRSQHENLIAFSNHSFYESDLVLFPSPHKESKNYGIQYHRVPRGCFVNRRNMEEARFISDAVRDHFKNSPEESLGVVSMNAEQRVQIERAIETLAKDDVAFQGWLETDATRHESLFIKNLENVQGDERDVIFISMTYGPQEPGGKVYQRFGPINSDVGWRRLNVLFTRAKKRMHIFSSMGSEDIVVGSSSKRGVSALHDFLSFCETGILHKIERETGRAPDSDFEVSVIKALRDEGFECIAQVGTAGFFIDVAVVDPGKPGRYLMGIECDGATYHSAKSARDRDRLRQTILERLGWRIRRIWSTDWFKNPHGVLAPIIRELHELKSPIVIVEPEIGHAVDLEETQVDRFAFDEMSLKDKLVRFDQEVIRKDHPETPEDKRLLRPAMLEALLKYTPTSKAEFLEMIPFYIREATAVNEGKYMQHIYEIINASLEAN